MRLPAGYVARPATWDDLDDVVDVFKACDLADVGFADPVREHIVEEWRSTGYELSRDSCVVTTEEVVVAYATVGGLDPSSSMETFGRVHPAHRGRGIGGAIVEWGEAHALGLSPWVPVVRNAAPATDPAARRLLEGAGYAEVRTFWHMTRDLKQGVEQPPEVSGVEFRSYDHATDVQPAFDALEEAFADHWGVEPYPYEQHERDLAEADPELVTVARADGEVVGVAYGRMVEGDGWVNVVGVRPPWRGRGIARTLLLRVLARLAALGASWATLNVDAENTTGATRLYESAGMHVHRAWTLFEKRLGQEP